MSMVIGLQLAMLSITFNNALTDLPQKKDYGYRPVNVYVIVQ